MLGSTTIAIGAVVQAACMNAAMQYAGRVIAGLGTGMNTATAGRLCEGKIGLCRKLKMRRCLAVRDLEDAQSWQADYHSDGQLYHGLVSDTVTVLLIPSRLTRH